MADDVSEFFQDTGAKEYWTDYDIRKELKLAPFGEPYDFPEDTRELIRQWASTKVIPERPRLKERLYQPIVDPFEIRVLEIKAGAFGDELKGALHHCSVEFVHERPHSSIPDTRCSLSMDDLTTQVPYTALSYTWGPPQFDADFDCDGHGLKITRSLEAALRRFRREDRSVVMWIDQICIDQKNNKEKEQQIPLMSRVYRHAENTAIWLGEETEGSKSAVELLEDVNIRLQFTGEEGIDPGEFERLQLPGPKSQTWRDLWDFLSRPWFTRLWIIQEVKLSRDPWIVCGNSLMTWGNLSSSCNQLTTTEISRWMQTQLSAKGRDVCQLAWELDQLHGTLFALMVQTRYAQCYDARDKVYGLLGITDDTHRAAVKVSYDDEFPQSKLYHSIVVHHLSLDSRSWSLTEVLCSVDHDSPELPSWVPDFSKPRQTVAFGFATSSQGIYKAHGRFEPVMLKIDAVVDSQNDKELHVRGFFFDTVVKLSDVFEEPDITYVNPSTENQTLLQFWEFVKQLEIYPGSHTLFSAFWHTLVAGKDGLGRLKCPETFAEIASLLLDASTGMEPSLSDQTYTPRQKRPVGRGRLELSKLEERKAKSPGEVFQDLQTAMKNALKNRRLGFTRNGYLGLFPAHTEIGDEVHVFDGCNVPFALRKAAEGKFRLVGECYVCGIMDGEAVRPDTSLQDLVLV